MLVKPSVSAGGKAFPIVFEGSWVDPDSGRDLRLYPIMAIAPVYPKIRVTFIDVHKILLPLSKIIALYFGSDDYEWDVHLTTNNSLKEDIRETVVDPAVLSTFLLLQQPRFIWRATLVSDGRTMLDFLFDATDMAPSMPMYRALFYDAALRDWMAKLLTDTRARPVIGKIVGPRVIEFLSKEIQGG